MKFLSKAELRYLIKDEERISKRLKNDLIEYCSTKSINLNKWSVSNQEWNNEYNRIEIEREPNRLLIRKLESAKKADVRSEIFIIVMVVILLIGTIYVLITKGIEDYGSIIALIFVPVLAFMITELSKRLKQKKIEYLEDKTLQIEGKNLVFLKNREEIINRKMSNINYYWQEGTEAGEGPTITLDIQLEDNSNVRIDEEGNYKELLILANEIAENTGVNLLFLNKNAPVKCFVKL